MLPKLPQDVFDILPLVPKIGIAVSGGGDSIALLLAAHGACQQQGCTLYAVTVNHGLRAGADAECRFVRNLCENLAIPHDLLHWDGLAARGNIQAAARDARYRLISGWAQDLGIADVFLGHTADDQAETLLMAIGRGAGVAGLAGMSRSTVKHGVTFLRPWLHVSRSSLRRGLTQIGQDWVDDPSNVDRSFQRVRVRSVLGALADAGVPLSAFGQVADNMALTAAMLDSRIQAVIAEHVIADQGDYLMRGDLWKRLGFEQARRLAVSLITAVNGGDAAPRRGEQREVLRRLRQNENATLAGCRISRGWGMVRFSREPQALVGRTGGTTDLWDGRWKLTGPHDDSLHVAALLDGIADCPDWRRAGLPQASLRASPAIWRRDHLVSAPLARLYQGWTLQNVADLSSYRTGH